LQEEGHFVLHINMIEVGVGPPQFEKHTFPKRVCQKIRNLETNMEPLEPNSLEK